MAQIPSLSILKQLIEGGSLASSQTPPAAAPAASSAESTSSASSSSPEPTPAPLPETTAAVVSAPAPAPTLRSGTLLVPIANATSKVVAQPTKPKAQPKPIPMSPPPSDHYLKILAENAPVAMAIFDADMKYLYANQRWLEFFKLEQTEVVGRSQYEVFPSLHPGWRHVYERALSGQVVRSDRDSVNQAGRPVLYRWEVRPWRNAENAVSGVMITCLSIPGVQSKDLAENATPAVPAAAATESGVSIWDLPLPTLALDAQGRVCRWSAGAGAVFSSEKMIEGQTSFWDLFGEGENTAQLRSATLNAVHRAAAGERDLEPLVVSESLLPQTAVTPMHWQVVAQTSTTGQSGAVVLVIGLPRVAPVAAPAPVPVVESPKDRDVERILRQRESRLRSVLEVAPSGLLVLDEHGRPVFHNARAAALLGRVMTEGQSMEDWLAHSCRDDRHREEVVRLWREGVWRKQLTRTITLTAADGVLKEIELRPASIPGGGMVVMLNDVTDERRSEELLRAMEAKFRALVHENPLPVVLCDRSGSVFEANAAAEDLTGRTRAELRGMAMEDWLAPESQMARSAALLEMVQRGDLFADLEVILNHREGRPVPASLRVAAVPDASGQPAGTIHFFQPVVEKPSAFVEEEEEHEPLIESFLTLPSNVVLLATDYHGRVTEWSEEAAMCFGFTQEEAMGRGLHTLFRPSDASGFYAELSTITASGLTQPVEWMFLHPEHGRRTGRFMLQPSTAGGMAVAIVTEEEEEEIPEDDFMATSQDEEVAAMVRPAPDNAQQLERERYLVGETHHRVKNHLQIITSMLNLQLSMTQNSEAREVLRSSQNRVRSIADLHQHLFGVAVGDVGSFAEFAKGLIGHLRDCYDVSEDRVAIELNVADSAVPDEWLMPLALSLNEMVSNAFKHAFPEGKSGSLKIDMKWSPESGELKVEDDGAGMPADFEERHFTGLGMKILRVFAGQLGGEVRISSEPDRGSVFRLLFPKAEQAVAQASSL